MGWEGDRVIWEKLWLEPRMGSKAEIFNLSGPFGQQQTFSGGSVCPHSVHLGSWVSERHFLHGLMSSCFLPYK